MYDQLLDVYGEVITEGTHDAWSVYSTYIMEDSVGLPMPHYLIQWFDTKPDPGDILTGLVAAAKKKAEEEPKGPSDPDEGDKGEDVRKVSHVRLRRVRTPRGWGR